MAEVKTYKCDICGKVYHVEDEHGECVTIFHEIYEEDSRDIYRYNYICPSCQTTILECIHDPKIIDNLHSEKDKLERCVIDMENIVKTLSDKICGFRCWTLTSAWIGKSDYVKELSQEIEEKYLQTDNHRAKWRTASFALIGIIIGLILSIVF